MTSHDISPAEMMERMMAMMSMNHGSHKSPSKGFSRYHGGNGSSRGSGRKRGGNFSPQKMSQEDMMAMMMNMMPAMMAMDKMGRGNWNRRGKHSSRKLKGGSSHNPAVFYYGQESVTESDEDYSSTEDDDESSHSQRIYKEYPFFVPQDDDGQASDDGRRRGRERTRSHRRRTRLSSTDMTQAYQIQEWFDFEEQDRYASPSSREKPYISSPAHQPSHKREQLAPPPPSPPRPQVFNSEADKSLALLQEGNRRFLTQSLSLSSSVTSSASVEDTLLRRMNLTKGQNPHTIVVCCSDSRVSPEIVFDQQQLGEIFVIRLAGNLTEGSFARASILYAVTKLHTPLIVVMGHESCGAVSATLQAMKDKSVRASLPQDLKELVGSIESGLKKSEATCHRLAQCKTDDEKVLCACIGNVEHQVHALHAHPDMRKAIKDNSVKVVGCYYTLNGAVTFL